MLSKIRDQLAWLRRHPAYKGPSTVARLIAWGARASTGRGAVVPFGGGRFYCPPERRGMAKLAYIFGDEYEGEIATLDRFVKPGTTVLDVGAHYGTYTLALSRLVGPDGRVIAIEPSGHAVEVLRRNLDLNDAGNVEVVQAAVSDEPGEVTLHVHADPSRTSLTSATGTLATEVVPAVTMDALVAGEAVGFVKIDVEGHELPALRGAATLLGRDRPVVQFEMIAGATRDVWDLLAAHGYGFRSLVDGRLRPVTSAEEVGTANVIAVPQ